MNILVTGFEDFGNVTENPSETLVNLLKQKYGDIETFIFKGYRSIDDNLNILLAKHNPDVVLMFGLASKTPYVRLERVATLPDKTKGEKSYSTRLPLKEIYTNIVSKDIEVKYSDSAGSYWCNYLFYKVCQLKSEDKTSLYGFIHIPNLSKYESVYKKNLDLSLLGSSILDSFAN